MELLHCITGSISFRPTNFPVKAPKLTILKPSCSIVTFAKVNQRQGSIGNVGDPNGKRKAARLELGSAPTTAADDDCSLIKGVIEVVRDMLKKMGQGNISMSPYDTAWVAMIRETTENHRPRFPESLRWIAEHQLPDGSWGDEEIFELHDRLLNTLACVITLDNYTTYQDQRNRGLAFLCENMPRIGEATEDHMPIGFEMAFPSLIDMARKLGLGLPFDAPGLKHIYNMRTLKMARIPLAAIHKLPTTLLHSLEGLLGEDFDWAKLLLLQSSDGSFLFSPSSTAFAVICTGDKKSLQYLETLTARFEGGVPNVYPVDLFEHLWAVDRLQRLGIARYFKPEIESCLDHVYDNWTEDGICWASGSSLYDIDDTAMGFRLLRLHGYNVSPDVFRNFRRDGKFFCLAGQSSQAVTGMYNLYRAAQVAFQGEEILEEARCFSTAFLREKQSRNQLVDKWIIAKDLQGEVEYALDFPWFASLPRVETREYLEQYGGDGDVWIGKTLYRMPLVNNKTYLELAKADFNMCQAVHQREWLGFLRWFDESVGSDHNLSRQRLIEAYFLATCSIYEPERSVERLGWARTAVLLEVVREYLGGASSTDEKRGEFLEGLLSMHDWSVGHGNGYPGNKNAGGLLETLCSTIYMISVKAAAASATEHRRFLGCLQQAWAEWIMTAADGGHDAVLLCRTLEVCAGRFQLEQHISGGPLLTSSIACHRAISLTSALCRQLGQPHGKMQDCAPFQKSTSDEDKVHLMEDVRGLVQCVLDNSNGDGRDTMQTFLTIAKSFFYVCHCPPETMKIHIAKVLFDRVA